VTNCADTLLIGRRLSDTRVSRRKFARLVVVGTTRPGWGERHPTLVALLGDTRPAAEEDVVWGGGAVALHVAVHLDGLDEVPDELVTSGRCVVRVRDRIVVCTTADGGSHPLPGGRREPGETARAAARREVHEETGWFVDEAALQPIGWLHFAYRSAVDPAFAKYPHPDFVHAVFVADAVVRDDAQGGGWSDTEGYEVSSRLLDPDDALAVIGDRPLDRLLLERAIGRR
jgi:ADP-ribose pyrophosphatase YjhB (NUDIX family)